MCHCVVPNVPTVRQWSAAHACVNRRWENVGRGIVVDDLETLNPRPHEFHLAPLLEKESSCEPVNATRPLMLSTSESNVRPAIVHVPTSFSRRFKAGDGCAFWEL